MLEVTKVHKRFRGVHALRSVSFSVPNGVVVAIVGDNGAGKSTLMKYISGAMNPDSGTISFNGTDLTHCNPKISRASGIEMIYQDLALCRLQDVVTNVFMGVEHTKGVFLNRSSMAKRCGNAFKKLGIHIPINSIVGKLSGGQQQSIAVARAMIANPQLLIMDEPTAALAVKETENVLKHIANVKKQGVSVIMISHNLLDVLKVADRVIVMRQGAISYDLAPEETDIRDLTAKVVGE